MALTPPEVALWGRQHGWLVEEYVPVHAWAPAETRWSQWDRSTAESYPVLLLRFVPQYTSG